MHSAELTKSDAEFHAVHEADRAELLLYYRQLEPGGDDYVKENPGYRLAPQYFWYYLDRRPSQTATLALSIAFEWWDYLKGVSGDVQAALSQVSSDKELPGDRQLVQETWRRIAVGVRRCFQRDDNLEDGLSLLEGFAAKTSVDAVEATLLRETAEWRARIHQTDVALREFERILDLDTSQCSWYVEYRARGFLSGYANLGIGEAAPHFAERDLEGNLIDLHDHRGEVVLIDFWSRTCPFCFPELEFLRQSRLRHSADRLLIVSAAMDQDVEELRKRAQKERLDWPQICEGRDWDDPLFLLFNIEGIPSNYLIDQDGVIVAKELRGDDLTNAIDSLLS